MDSTPAVAYMTAFQMTSRRVGSQSHRSPLANVVSPSPIKPLAYQVLVSHPFLECRRVNLLIDFFCSAKHYNSFPRARKSPHEALPIHSTDSNCA